MIDHRSPGKQHLVNLISSIYRPYSYGCEGLNLDIRPILFRLSSLYVTLNIKISFCVVDQSLPSDGKSSSQERRFDNC